MKKYLLLLLMSLLLFLPTSMYAQSSGAPMQKHTILDSKWHSDTVKSTPTLNDVLKWNGSKWVAGASSSSSTPSGKVCKTVTVPSDADNLLFDIASARTVTKLWGICKDGTSVVITLQDAGADGTGSTAIATLTVDTDGATQTTISSATLHDGDIIKLDIGTVTGVVTQVMVCYE